MIYNLKIPVQIQTFEERAKWLIKNEKRVELREIRKPRTIKQNRYLHLICGWFGLQTGYDRDTVKVEFFKKVNREMFEVDVSGNLGTFKRWKSSSELNTLEMTQAIERFRNWANLEAGIYLPAPNETEHLAQLEEEVNRYGNREYL